jgi:hypothetical protein
MKFCHKGGALGAPPLWWVKKGAQAGLPKQGNEKASLLKIFTGQRAALSPVQAEKGCIRPGLYV